MIRVGRHKSFFFGVVLFYLSSLSTACQSETTLTVDQVEAVIRKEIRLGSKASEILQFLDSQRFRTHQFDHTSYLVAPAIVDLRARYSSDQKEKALAGRLHGFIDGALHETRRSMFTTSSIVVSFYFNSDDQLIDYTVKKIVGK